MPPALRGPATARRGPGLVGRIIATVFAVVVLAAALMVSVFVFAAALVAGLALFGWLWWKMRRVVRQMQQDPRFRALQEAADPTRRPGGDAPIEGEIISKEWKDDPPR